MSTLEPVRNLGESIVVANLDGPSTTSCIKRTVNEIMHAGLETPHGQGLGFLPHCIPVSGTMPEIELALRHLNELMGRDPWSLSVQDCSSLGLSKDCVT